MRRFEAPDDHPTPFLDFVSPEGRAAIRAALAKNAPDIIEACAAHGAPNKAEERDYQQYLVDCKAEDKEPESFDDWLLTDRYWHGEHRVPARKQQTMFDLSTPEGREGARAYLAKEDA